MSQKIQTALVSVYHKEGLEEILQELDSLRVKFISTGGTREFIESLGYECEAVEDVSGYPSILGGRVKTLHPRSEERRVGKECGPGRVRYYALKRTVRALRREQ